MGSVCSLRKKNSVVNTDDVTVTGSTGEECRTQYSISASILCSSIWNPFRVSRDEAEILLQDAYPGAYVFSHNITSEIFLSMSTGKYVCHHPILQFSQHYQIGGRDFKNIEAAILFYRSNPLGDAVLTEQFNPLNNESRTETRSRTSPSISSPPPLPKTKLKRVTFEANAKPMSISTNDEGVIGCETTPKTTQTTVVESDVLDDEKQAELFRKLQNKPRKSICRVQPEDSLSTSSGHMFKEEEF